MKKWLLKFLKGERGVTLVELLAVMIILGVLAAIAVPAIGGIITKSKKNAYVSTMENAMSATQLYVEGSGESSLAKLATEDSDFVEDGSTGVYYLTSDLLVSKGYLATDPNNVDGIALNGSGKALLGGVAQSGNQYVYYVATPTKTSDSKAWVHDTSGNGIVVGVTNYTDSTTGETNRWVPLSDLNPTVVSTVTLPTP